MNKLYKAFTTQTKAIDLEAGIFEAVISTESVDRQGDIVRASGAKIENFLKNPVVLWAHQYDQPPVARALSIEIIPAAGLKSTFQFPEWGINPQADVTRRLWAAGFLNATSIGFIPLAVAPVNAADKWGPQDYQEWELLEYSIVPVPANQEALRLAVKSMTETITKRGRVLSADNEKRLRTATILLQEVLAKLEDAPEPDKQLTGDTPDTEHPAKEEPNINDSLNDASPETLEILSNYFSALKGLLS